MSNKSRTFKTIGDPGDRTKPCAIIAFLLEENNLAIAASGYNHEAPYPFDPIKGRKIALRRAQMALDRHSKGLENSKNLATLIEMARGNLGDIISMTSVSDIDGSLTLVLE